MSFRATAAALAEDKSAAVFRDDKCRKKYQSKFSTFDAKKHRNDNTKVDQLHNIFPTLLIPKSTFPSPNILHP
jgi:hypothetical protein